MDKLNWIECPRDAMQGIHEFIPTSRKVEYINQLLKCGFDTLDFGSFVSSKAIPQMRDTADVLDKLVLTDTKLLAIIANERGASDAVQFEEISYLGFPFSVSETFQQRNTNSSIEESLGNLEKIQNLCLKNSKKLVVYLSMGFGNPYGDVWNPDIVINWSERLHTELGVEILALSDTIGVANDANIRLLFENLIPALPKVEFGAHFHTVPARAEEVVNAAYESGCRRFDSAIKGFGGCPMATDDLTGNMPTESILRYLEDKKIEHQLNLEEFNKAFLLADHVFPIH